MGRVCLLLRPNTKWDEGPQQLLLSVLEKLKLVLVLLVGVDIVAIADWNRWLGAPVVAPRLPPNSPFHVLLHTCPVVHMSHSLPALSLSSSRLRLDSRDPHPHKIIHRLHMCRHTHAHVPHVHPVVSCTAPPLPFHCISTCSRPPSPLSSFLKGQGCSHQA